jgi:carbon monoxide dehydrogenase subunit G
MAEIIVRKHIVAPIEEVFARATDLEKAADVIAGIQKIEMLSEGPVGKGTRFRETRIMFGREATEEMEIVEFDPPRRWALGAHSHGCSYHSEYLLEPSGPGTDLKFTFQARPQTLLAKILSVAMKPMMKSMGKLCNRDLDDLKSAIER